MTLRPIARPLALLAGLAVAIAACGPAATATNAPVITAAPVTQAPAATGGGQPSDPFASFHGALALEELLPDEIGGEQVTALSMTGEEFLEGGSSPYLEAALAALNKKTSDLSVAFGGGGGVQVIAFQIAGVAGNQALDAVLAANIEETPATLTNVSFGGKSVKKYQPTDPDGDVSYVYTARDVVFVVAGEDLTDALLNEVFSKLP